MDFQNSQAVLVVYKIMNALSKKINITEFFLNTLFIILFFVITIIVYWDTINSQVAKTSRCKRQLDMASKVSGIYTVKASDKNNKPLYNISYDLVQYNTNVECACDAGTLMNSFDNIPVRNMRNNTDTFISKKCNCDKYYEVGYNNEKVNFDGDPGIVRYIINQKNTDFFDNLTYNPYS